MVKYNKTHRLTLRATLFATLLFTALSATASTVSVDGNLSDLQAAIAAEQYNPQNTVTATDPQGSFDAPATENLNGFDIKNVYAWFGGPNHTLYLGMTFFGQVGTAGGNEGGALDNCPPSFGVTTTAGIFDACETYGFNIDIDNNGSVEYNLQIKGDGSLNVGPDAIRSLTGTLSGTLGSGAAVWSINESSNAVEFSLSGLDPYLLPYNPANPRLVRIGFFAGSTTNILPEDTLFATMQVVPVPAAAWLLGSGLAGLLGFSVKRRGTHKH